MNKNLILGVVIGVALATGGAVLATRGLNAPPEFVDVVRVAPQMEKIETPREVCRDVTSTREVPRDDNLNNGTIIGALVGGAVGNQVGDGRGRDAATVAGLVAGGYAGREIDRRHKKTRTVIDRTQSCRTVTKTIEKQVGFRVTYALNGERRSVLMERDPGEQVRLAEVAALDTLAPVSR
jgi:uncharacterized protein YcfJ